MERELSLYLHFPFCKRKCFYCDFFSVSGQDDTIPAYMEALKLEMEQYLPQHRHLSSIYFGGGTPSYVPTELLIDLLRFIRGHFFVSPRTEITIEVNPGTIEVEDLAALHEAGFNRLSIGLQAAQDRLLQVIGRIHSWDEFSSIYELARETGFTDIGVDLIFGLPGQTKADWEETLTKVTALRPTHISAYGLQVEPGTPLAEMIKNGQLELPDEDQTVEMMQKAMDFLPTRGFQHYEISNYARSGFRSLHNLGYWSGRDYLGIGSGAHSKIYGERRANLKDIDRYIHLIQNGESVIEFRESLDRQTMVTETIMLGLRLCSGISLKKFAATYGVDLLQKAAAEIELFQDKHYLQIQDGRLSLTNEGLIVSNTIISSLLKSLD